jgi:hypothetical protein
MFEIAELDKEHKDRWSAGAVKLDDLTPQELSDWFFKIHLRYRQVKEWPSLNYIWDYLKGIFRFGWNLAPLIALLGYFVLDNSVLIYRLLGRRIFVMKGE